MASHYTQLGLGKIRLGLPISDEQAHKLSRYTEVSLFKIRGVSKKMLRKINRELRDRQMSLRFIPWGSVLTEQEKYETLEERAKAVYAATGCRSPVFSSESCVPLSRFVQR